MEQKIIKQSKESKITSYSSTSNDHFFISVIKNNKPLFFTGIACILLVIMGSILLDIRRIQNEVYANSQPPKKTVYTDMLPPGFPAAVPIATTSKRTQSYSKEYSDKMYQTSAVFSSGKSVLENFALYEAFLTSGNWKIISSQKNEKKASLYGRKEGSDIEVLLRKNAATSTDTLSHIIINVYKK